MSAALGALDEVANPGAGRAADMLREQNEWVMPMPSPGDRPPTEGRVVITTMLADHADHA
jgi:hypothetical protein